MVECRKAKVRHCDPRNVFTTGRVKLGLVVEVTRRARGQHCPDLF